MAARARTRLAVNLSGNSVYRRVGDRWEAYFPLLDVRASGATEAEARAALIAALEPVVNHGSDELKQRWQSFCQANLIEIPLTDEDEAAERERRRIVADQNAATRPSFPALDPETFDHFVAGTGIVVVDFWAPWCEPCMEMVPVLDELARTGPDLRIASVDVDAHESLWERFELRGIPTLLVFKSGAEIGRILGTRTAQELADEIGALVRT